MRYCSLHVATNYLPFNNVLRYTRRIVAWRIVHLSLATPPSTLYAPFDIVRASNTFAFSLSQHHAPSLSPFHIMHVLFSPPPPPPGIHLRLQHPCHTLHYVHQYALFGMHSAFANDYLQVANTM